MKILNKIISNNIAIGFWMLCLIFMAPVGVFATQGNELNEYKGEITDEYERQNDPLYNKYNNMNVVQNVEVRTFGTISNTNTSTSSIKWGDGLTHDKRFDNNKKLYGVDVSKWNGDIDWAKVKNSGLDYVIIRLGYRGQADGKLVVDPYYDANMKGAHDAGLKVGVYIYTQSITKTEAKEEAEFCAEKLEPYSSYIDFPVMYDIENTSSDRMGKAKLNTSKRTSFCVSFCKRIEELGYKGGVYSYKAYFEDKLTMSEIDPYYYIWLAEWKKSPTYTGTYGMWQYSDGDRKNDTIIAYKVPGISGNVDLDVYYDNIPAKVKGLKQSDSTASTIKLTWNKIDKVDGYQVKVYSASEELLAVEETKSNSMEIPELDSGMEYQVKVRAYYYFENTEEYVYGSSSSLVSMYTCPDKVKDISMSEATKTTVTLKWSKVAGTTGYEIYKYDATTKKTTKLASTKSLSYTVKNLSAGKTYDYKIMAYKTGGDRQYNGSMSEVFKAATRAPKLKGLKASAVKNSSLTLSWTKQSGITVYQVFCYDSKGKELSKQETTKNSITIKNLGGATAYSFKVRSVIRTASGAESRGVYSSALKLKTYPNKVSGMKVSTLAKDSIKFSWDKVKGATGYYVYKYDTKTKKSTKLATVKTNTYTWKKLGKTTKYTIKVVAYTTYDKKELKGSASDAFAAYTKPDTVEKLKLSGGKDSNIISLSWKGVKKASGYRVFKFNEKGKLIDYVDVKSTSCTLKKVDAGSYKFKVKAFLKTDNYVSLGGYSNEKTTYVIPAKVTGLKATDVTTDSATISWNKINGVEGYQIMMYDESTGKYVQLATIADTSFRIDNLSPDKNYKVKVLAYISYKDKVKKGSYSDELNFVTLEEHTEE